MAEIEIKRIGRRLAEVPIRGTAPLVVHRFDEKAKQTMLDGMQGRKTPKAHRDPQADYQRAFHRLPDGSPGFPASGYKAATVYGCRFFQDKKLSMVLLKSSIYVAGEGPDMLVRIEERTEPKMREDYARISMNSTDLRYRPQWDDWGAVLKVVFIPSLMSVESVVALVDAGGLGGIGEMRPSSKMSASGVFGTYEVDSEREIKEINL